VGSRHRLGARPLRRIGNGSAHGPSSRVSDRIDNPTEVDVAWLRLVLTHVDRTEVIARSQHHRANDGTTTLATLDERLLLKVLVSIFQYLLIFSDLFSSF